MSSMRRREWKVLCSAGFGAVESVDFAVEAPATAEEPESPAECSACAKVSPTVSICDSARSWSRERNISRSLGGCCSRCDSPRRGVQSCFSTTRGVPRPLSANLGVKTWKGGAWSRAPNFPGVGGATQAG